MMVDKAQVAELYRHRNAVREVIHEYEADWDVVDDLMQEVYAQALSAPFDDKSKVLTWLCTIARNVAVDHVRSRQADKRAQEVLEVYLPSSTDEDYNPTPYYDRWEGSTHVEDMTGALDPALITEAEDSIEHRMDSLPHRVAVVAKLRLKGYTNQEVAEHLGIAEKTVRNLWTETRKFFRDISQFNTTNRARERDGEQLARAARLSQSDVERTQLSRFEKRVQSFEKRRIRIQHPACTLHEWDVLYNGGEL